VLDAFPGRELEGTAYEPPFGFIPASAYGERGHTVLLGDFVTADDGTGLVHTAIAFGEDDFRLGQQAGLAVVNPVRLDGTYDERIAGYEGVKVKDADRDLIADLEVRGRVLRVQEYEHAYPHCWRCGTPLLYYAKPSWYIATSGCTTASWPPTRRSPGIPSTSSTGASATGWPATSTGRSPRALLGHAACPCGAARPATST
jgi:isoleucyl-tRNA synthetase